MTRLKNIKSTSLYFCNFSPKKDKPNRKNAVFLGASVVAKLMQNNNEFWISKEQFQEGGAREILHQEGL